MVHSTDGAAARSITFRQCINLEAWWQDVADAYTSHAMSVKKDWPAK
jgi:hypothetical protein